MNNIVKNPYVGPRTFQKEDGDIFFGREREARDIMALVASERLVLFYAQSGAGKSSLLNTRIIPELEDGEFEVLPVGRVQGELPPELEVENVYAYNLMNSLLQQKTNPEALAKLSLSEFLCMLDFNESGYSFNAKRTTAINTELHWRRILIIDQFEEIFTTHLDAWVNRSGFFRQLAQALNDDPYLTVILTMRDDYIASLDLYAHLLPGGLRTRYYMQRLTKETALKAVKNPVENIRPFSPGIAEKLVEDLSGIVVYRSGGAQEIQSGQYVEPVQLQVVCYSLWENLPPEGTEITGADLLEVGDVNQSLEGFYNNRVAAVAKEKNISERMVREWFDKELITGNKTRNMVLQEKGSSAGLRNDVIQALQGDLVRTELRAGQIWIELSHDRLVEPVLASNAKWFEQNLSTFQRRVVLWIQQSHSENILLGEKELAEAEKEASTLNLTKDEQEFLEESKKQIQRIQRDQTQRRRIFAALVVSVVLLIAAVGATFVASQATKEAKNNLRLALAAKAEAEVQKSFAEDQKAEADRQKTNAEDQKTIAEAQKLTAQQEARKALAGKLAAEADSKKGSDHTLALLLSAQAYELESTLLTRTTLFELLQFTPYTRLFGYSGPVTSLAVSPDGTMIASSSCREYSNNQCKYGEIILTNAQTHQLIRKIPGNYGVVNSLAFHKNKDMLLLAAGGCVPVDDLNKGCTDNKGQITLWNVTNATEAEPVALGGFDSKHTGLVKTIAFSYNGSWLASGSFDTRIILWDIRDPAKPSMIGNFIQGHTSFVNSVAFSNDDKTLVSASDDLNIILWDISRPGEVTQLGLPVKQQTASVNSIAFSPDGTKFASASDDHTVTLWNWDAATRKLTSPQTLQAHGGFVKSVAFNPDGTMLASAGFDGKVILWETSTGNQIGLPLSGHTKAINVIAFSNPDNGSSIYLLSGGDDRLVVQWNLSSRHPLSQPVKEAIPPNGIGVEASSGDIVARVENEQQIVLNGKSLQNEHTGAVNSLSFGKSNDGKLLLASASDDQTVILWDVTDINSVIVFLKLDGFENPIKMAYFDGRQLVTIEKNSGRTIRWDIDPSVWEAHACENIDLTESQMAEWNRLVPDQTYQETCQSIP